LRRKFLFEGINLVKEPFLALKEALVFVRRDVMVEILEFSLAYKAVIVLFRWKMILFYR